MNIRCAFCQTPYTLGRIEKLDALQHMYANNLSHYDAHCPRCRKATPVQRQKLEMTMPNWREALKELEAEMKAHPQQEAPAHHAQPEAAPVAEAEPEPAPAKAKTAKPKAAVAKTTKAPAKAKPATKTTAKKKSA